MDLNSNSDIVQWNRCHRCFRPLRLCYCHTVPIVDNRTEVVILQHRRERFHPFNTARIVQHSLLRCQLLADHNLRLAKRFESTRLSARVGLLYPSDKARVLTELSAADRPDQLVVLDGTWHHAKTLMRDIPRLRHLPQFQLAPSSPGRYRIRREPNEHALSTIEATVAALKALEPETKSLDQLLQVFESMINTQIGQTDNSNWRRNRRRRKGSTNVPRAISGDLSNVVVAYGEQEQGVDSRYKKSQQRAPIYWVAKRMVSDEEFRCAITSESSHDQRFLDCMRLSKSDFDDSVSIDLFRQRWKKFLRPSDQLVVYHPSTARVLENIEADFVSTVILKSVNAFPDKAGGMLDDILAANMIQPQPGNGSRASQRLANAIAYVHFLNSLATTSEP